MIKSMNNIGGDRTKLQFRLCTLTEAKENGRENAKNQKQLRRVPAHLKDTIKFGGKHDVTLCLELASHERFLAV